MPIAKVQDINGVIHRIEVPEGATPREIEAFAALSIPQQSQTQAQPLNAGQSISAGGLTAIPFAKDVAALAGAAIYGRNTKVPFLERYAAAKRFFDEKQSQAMSERPGLAIPSALAGAALTIPLMPAKLAQMGQGATIAGRAAGGAAQGAIAGGVAGLGEGVSLNERLQNAIEGGVFGGAAGSAFAPIAAGAVKSYNVAREWLQKNVGNVSDDVVVRFAALMQQNPTAQTDDALRELSGKLQSTQVDDAMTKGNVLSLTKGQLTQKPEIQSLEQGALRGAYGAENQALMQTVRQKQSDEAKAVIQKIAGTEITPETRFLKAGEAATQVKEAYKAAKSATSEAYKEVARLNNGNPVKIAKTYVEGIKGRFDEILNGVDDQTGFDLKARGMEEAKRLLGQFDDLVKSDAPDFQKLEQWRGQVSRAIRDTQTPSEREFLRRSLESYDRAMESIPTGAVVNGDIQVLNAMEKARGLRKAQGVLFERNKAIKDVLENAELTNEELANTFLSASSNKYGARSARMIQSALRAVGEKRPELQARFKAGFMAKILNNSMMDELSAEGAPRVSFDKLASNLKEYIYNNPTLFRTVHSDLAERDAIVKFYKDVARIKSMQPGAVNYSNTANMLLNALQKISPTMTNFSVGSVGIAPILKGMSEGGAAVDLRDSISTVMKNTALGLNGQPFIYGTTYGAGSMAKTIMENE